MRCKLSVHKRWGGKNAQEIVHAACDTVEPLQDLLEFKAEKMDLRI